MGMFDATLPSTALQAMLDQMTEEELWGMYDAAVAQDHDDGPKNYGLRCAIVHTMRARNRKGSVEP